MNILSIDLGAKTGWAIEHCGEIISGVVDLRDKETKRCGWKFLNFRKVLNELNKEYGIGIVVFELVRRHLGTDAAHCYGAFWGMLTAWCEEHNIPYEGTPVQTIKKFATGKGNATKQMVIDSIRAMGYSPADDNEADAIALLLFTVNKMYKKGQ